MQNTGRLRNDERGQMFILEVLTAGLLIIAAINFITTLPAPTQGSTLYLHKWELSGKDVLRALDNLPSNKYMSSLDEGICNDIDIVVDELNESLPATLSYNIYLRNRTSTITLYHSGIPSTSSSARANYIAYISGGYCKDWSNPLTPNWKAIGNGVYEISVVIWHEARG